MNTNNRLIRNSVGTAAAIAWMVFAAGSAASLPVEELVVNGSFERPKTPANGLLTLRPDTEQARLEWKVEAGNVEITRTGFDTGAGILSGRAAGGEQWLDLDGTRAGTVSQTLATRPGVRYGLRFDYANNPDPDGRPPYRAHVNVRDAKSGAELIDPVPLAHDTATLTDFRWTRSGSIAFTAAGARTTIVFTSDNKTNSYHGIFLDNVSVVPRPTAVSLTAWWANDFACTASAGSKGAAAPKQAVHNDPWLLLPTWNPASGDLGLLLELKADKKTGKLTGSIEMLQCHGSRSKPDRMKIQDGHAEGDRFSFQTKVEINRAVTELVWKGEILDANTLRIILAQATGALGPDGGLVLHKGK